MVANRLEEEGLSKDLVEKVRRAKEKVKVGPRSVMLKWKAEGAIDIDRVIDSEEESDSSEEEEYDPVNVTKLPNGMKFR